jgi:urea transport system substrate-binding protein
VIKALGDVTISGPRGTLRMNKEHHTPLSMRLGQVRSDGSIRILETYASVEPGSQCPNME